MYLLIGAGGHAKVIAEAIKSNGKDLYGFLDDQSTSSDVLGYPILGGIKELPLIITDNSDLEVIIAIGDNVIRKKIFDELTKYNVRYGCVIHPKAYVSPSATINEGSVIMPGAIVNSSSTIGKHSIVNSGAIVEHDCIVEDFVHLSPGVTLYGHSEVGEMSYIGSNSSTCLKAKIEANSYYPNGSVIK